MNNKSKAPNDKVILEKLETVNNRVVQGIHIPDKSNLNEQLTKARIVSVGPVAKKLGLKTDDIVLYDTYSAYEDTHPYVVIKVENIILKEQNEI